MKKHLLIFFLFFFTYLPNLGAGIIVNFKLVRMDDIARIYAKIANENILTHPLFKHKTNLFSTRGISKDEFFTLLKVIANFHGFKVIHGESGTKLIIPVSQANACYRIPKHIAKKELPSKIKGFLQFKGKIPVHHFINKIEKQLKIKILHNIKQNGEIRLINFRRYPSDRIFAYFVEYISMLGYTVSHIQNGSVEVEKNTSPDCSAKINKPGSIPSNIYHNSYPKGLHSIKLLGVYKTKNTESSYAVVAHYPAGREIKRWLLQEGNEFGSIYRLVRIFKDKVSIAIKDKTGNHQLFLPKSPVRRLRNSRSEGNHLYLSDVPVTLFLEMFKKQNGQVYIFESLNNRINIKTNIGKEIPTIKQDIKKILQANEIRVEEVNHFITILRQ